MKAGVLILYLTLAAIYLTHCDADRSMRPFKGLKHGGILTHKHRKELRMILRHYDLNPSFDSSNAKLDSVSSSNSFLPPYDSLAPIPLPENSPPLCLSPPNPSLSPPGSPSTPSVPNPASDNPSSPEPIQNPPTIFPGPPGSLLPTPTPPQSVPYSPESTPNSPDQQNPPIIIPGPPNNIPSPLEPIQNPPTITPGSPPNNIPSPSEPIQNPPGGPPGSLPTPTPESVPSPPEPIISSPPNFEPNPPSTTIPSPSGGGFVPSPIVFEPPIVYPPPNAPPPPYHAAPSGALWCVAKPSVPDPILQEAMNYACGSGADCDSIQTNGLCFEPNTVLAHASYAFNNFWQNTKVTGGTCDFGKTAILVTKDPSYDGCHFVYN